MSTLNPLFFLKVSCILHWGWRLSMVPFSKSRPPLLVPPPTTLIGALAYPLNRALKLPEAFHEYSGAECLRETLRYVGLRMDSPLISFFDLSKIHFFYRKEVRNDAVALGKTYTLSLKKPECEFPAITICYVIDETKAYSKFGDEAKNKLIEAAFSITRIGSRESLATTLNVSYGEAKISPQRSGKTSFSFLRKAISDVKGSFIICEVIDWEISAIGDYSRAERELMIVPYDTTEYSPKPVEVELSNDYVFIDAGGDLVIARR